ncbi:MAG: endonuclease III [Bacillota bacterium]
MKKDELLYIVNKLDEMYPTARPMLDFTSPYELLVAVTLSAQCTDERVNKVTRELFKVANTPQQMSELSEEQILSHIKTCGLGSAKSKALKNASRDILEKFGGEVPADIKLLQTLQGVGIKTANVVASVAFGIPAIAVDTHVFRVSNRLGLANGKTLTKTQTDLEKNIPKENWIKAHHHLIFHGRAVCKAQRPQCEVCGLKDNCKFHKANLRKLERKNLKNTAK